MAIVASEQQVVEAVCEARTARAPYEIVGGGTKRALGRPTPSNLRALQVAGLSGIVKYEPEELIMTVLPGTPVREIEMALTAKGQRLGFDPPDWGPLLGAPARSGTIGGAISADISGPARVRYGAVRDQLLGFRAVNGFGEAFKAGGKVVKNVTGFDMPKLVCGAFGTLCVLTELTLRVFPRPARAQTFVLGEMAPQEGFALLRRVWASPLEATGLAYSDNRVAIRLEGETGPLAEKAAMLRAMCGGRDPEVADESLFPAIADGTGFSKTDRCVWRVYLPPSRAADMAAQFPAAGLAGDCAGGILWIESDDHAHVRRAANALGGHAVLIRADERTRARIDVFEAEDRVRAQLTRSVKAAFDPLGLFNPGRMWDTV